MNEIRECVEQIAYYLLKLADCLSTDKDREDHVAAEAVTESAPAAEEHVPEISLEDVRGKLAEKSRDGKTTQVRELILKYGAERLSEVDPKHYADLLKDAEGL